MSDTDDELERRRRVYRLTCGCCSLSFTAPEKLKTHLLAMRARIEAQLKTLDPPAGKSAA